MFKYELGSTAKDKVTGYKGIIIGRHEWLYGCRRYSLQSSELDKGKPVDALSLDEEAIDLIKAAKPAKIADTGGPQPEPQRHREATRR